MVVISLLILVSYVAWVSIKEKDIPETISDTYYMITHKELFSLVIWSCAFLVLPACMEVWESEIKIIPFLSVMGLFIVGAAPRFKEEERAVHIMGASMSAIGSLLIAGWSWELALILIPVIGILYTSCNLKPGEDLVEKLDSWDCVFWIEMTCFMILYITLIDKLT